MSLRFTELDRRRTPLGDLSLRRRREPTSGQEIYEVKLGDEYLMSSMFVEAEVELARIALAAVPDRPTLDVVVGGLGLGYTARTVLEDPRVRELVVVDALAEVIEWHLDGLVPLGPGLTGDPRSRMVHGDFFALVAGDRALDGGAPRRFDVIAVDIDHSPRHVLNAGHSAFYTPDGLGRLRTHLVPGGAFALWSNDPPDADFLARLALVFPDATARVVGFPNPLQGREATNTVYLGTSPGE